MKCYSYVFFAVCISIANSENFEPLFTLPSMVNWSILNNLPPLHSNLVVPDFQLHAKLNTGDLPIMPQDKGVKITNINEAAFMASIQPSPGHQFFGLNAVFVAASWVFSYFGFVASLTNGGDKKKNIVVVSNTLDPCCGNDAIIHRVKKIVFSESYSAALVKTSGENHRFATPVKPSWVSSTTEPMRIFYFNIYQESMISHTNINLIDEAMCVQFMGPGIVCTPPVPIDSAWHTLGAILVNSNNEFVGTLVAAYGSQGGPEFFLRTSIFYDMLGEAVTDE